MKKTSSIGNDIYKGIGKAFSVMYNNPKTTLGIVGSLVLAKKIADNIHPAHQIFRGETQNILMKEQNSTLNQILNSVKKEDPRPEYNQQVIIPPLT